MSSSTLEAPTTIETEALSSELAGGGRLQTDAAPQKRSRHEIEMQMLIDANGPDQLSWKNVDWTVFVWMTVVHAGCLAAPFVFSWYALGTFVVMHWLTSSIGICLGYHRYLAHRSFKLSKPAEFFTMLCAVLTGEGTPLMWAATHRMHHQRSDHDGDPHSPLEGKWWSHLLWMFVRHSRTYLETLYRRYTPELADRPLMRFFERTFGLWLIGSAVLLAGVGYLVEGWYGAASMLVWGVFLRLTLAYHGTWLVNSATHLWGYRNYETRDQSKNLWWVAILAYGEGWHNNHHAHPSVAPAGHKWWEIDMTWWAIKLLRFLGQATDVKDHIPADRLKTTEETVT